MLASVRKSHVITDEWLERTTAAYEAAYPGNFWEDALEEYANDRIEESNDELEGRIRIGRGWAPTQKEASRLRRRD